MGRAESTPASRRSSTTGSEEYRLRRDSTCSIERRSKGLSDTGTRLIAFRRRLKCQGANARCCSLRNWDCDVGSRMRDALDREATPEGIEEVERLLKATTAEIVPLPKSRPVPKTSTEVLAMPTLP